MFNENSRMSISYQLNLISLQLASIKPVTVVRSSIDPVERLDLVSTHHTAAITSTAHHSQEFQDITHSVDGFMKNVFNNDGWH